MLTFFFFSSAPVKKAQSTRPPQSKVFGLGAASAKRKGKEKVKGKFKSASLAKQKSGGFRMSAIDTSSSEADDDDFEKSEDSESEESLYDSESDSDSGVDDDDIDESDAVKLEVDQLDEAAVDAKVWARTKVPAGYARERVVVQGPLNTLLPEDKLSLFEFSLCSGGRLLLRDDISFAFVAGAISWRFPLCHRLW